MINIISDIMIAFGGIVAVYLVVTSILFIMHDHYNKKNKSSEKALSFRDNLADMNKNFKNIKDYYALYIYTSAFNNNSLEYRIHSKPDWKDVSRINHDTIDVYLKRPFDFPDFSVEYTLSDYIVGSSIDLLSFMRDNDLDETDVTTLYYNNEIIGYLGIHKYFNGFYSINILEDVGMDNYINISFEYHHKLKNGKGLEKIIQKVII